MEFYKVDTHQIWDVSCLLFLNQANDFFCHPVIVLMTGGLNNLGFTATQMRPNMCGGWAGIGTLEN